jgi:hypothetical protein
MWTKKVTWEFIAKTMNDMGKNILSIGFASYFFKDLFLPLRFLIGIIGIALICWSIYLIDKKGVK